MESYLAGKPLYWSTAPTNQITALAVSCDFILKDGMEACWARHAATAKRFKAAVTALGLEHVADPSSGYAANTMTNIYYPEGMDKTLLPACLEEGVVFAQGKFTALNMRPYFRTGHMGMAVDAGNDYVERGVTLLEKALVKLGHKVELGTAAKAFKA